MRTEEIRKWIDEGGSLPEDLTKEEKEHLTKLGWSVDVRYHPSEQKWCEHDFLHGMKHGKWEGWYSNGQKCGEENWLHGMKHGVYKEWDEEGNLTEDQEYLYGNKIK